MDISTNTATTLSLTGVDIETAGLNFMRCHQWLEEAYESTTNVGIRRLIDDVMDELWAIGSVDGELGEMVIGALESVASALEVDSMLANLDAAH